jgi:hypothetical protein
MGSRLGILKTAAARLDLTLAEYQELCDAGQKWCCTCRRWRPITAFFLDPTRGSGLNAHCRTCKKPPPKIRIIRRGPEHPSWKGGDDRRRELSRARNCQEYNQWRLAVFSRDGFKCQSCGDAKGGNLHAHHIKSFANHPSLRYDINNGVTLCEPCHENEHRGKPPIKRVA